MAPVETGRGDGTTEETRAPQGKNGKKIEGVESHGYDVIHDNFKINLSVKRTLPDEGFGG